MLVGAAFLPHPAILLPAFAAQRGDAVDETIVAVRRACRWMADDLRPARLIIASPHRGHGFDVPMYFLRESLGRLPAVEQILTVWEEPLAAYVALGEAIAARERANETRVAVVASGDCSHVLLASGPYGYHPAGPLLDAAIVKAVRSGDPANLLGIDEAIVEAGKACGLRSFLLALAAVRPSWCEVVSYQAPYGVGYLVATADSTAAVGALEHAVGKG